jgi:uncharacterized protein (DUF305 family)
MATSKQRRRSTAILLVAFAAAFGLYPFQSLTQPPPSDFLARSDAAMSRMMKGMDAPRTGDVDRDFANMMIPHHQGAIDMAVAYLRYGENEQLRRLAQEIIVEQQQEIAVMQRAVSDIQAVSQGPSR